MRKFTVIALALLSVLLVATGGVVAHGNGDSSHTDAHETDSHHDNGSQSGSAADWATWMEQQMTEHMGADRAAQMQERMGMSYEEMGEHMGTRQNGSMMDGSMGDGMSGMGCH